MRMRRLGGRPIKGVFEPGGDVTALVLQPDEGQRDGEDLGGRVDTSGAVRADRHLSV